MKKKSEGNNPGTILILNGASSSGKTSLLYALQDSLDGPWLNAGIDQFIWMLPKRYLDRPLWDDVLGQATEAGDTGRKLFSGMHHALADLSRAGNMVLADHVLVEDAWVQECATLFYDLPAYLIGLRCLLEVLEERERSRKDRTLGQARAQHDRVHAHRYYDFEVDTWRNCPLECAMKIKEWLEAKPAPVAFRRLKRG